MGNRTTWIESPSLKAVCDSVHASNDPSAQAVRSGAGTSAGAPPAIGGAQGRIMEVLAGGAAEGEVAAPVADQGIGPAASDHQVAAAATDEQVVAVTTLQDTVAVAAIEAVVTRAAVQPRGYA